MADNFTITQGSGTTIGADEVVDGTLGTIKTQFIKIMDGTLDSTNKLIVTSSGAVKVDPSGVTSPVSGTVTANQGGTWTVQPGNTPNTTAWKIDGSAVTQPISASSLPLPTGAATDAQLSLLNAKLLNSTLCVTATGAAAAGVTLTLPAVVGQAHNITLLEIVAYSTAARTGGTTPVIVTTTNLPGSPAFTFGSGAAVGTTDTKLYTPIRPLIASVVNTATTIVCPATTSIIWRVNVFYYTI